MSLSDDVLKAWDAVFTPEVRAELDRKFREVDALLEQIPNCIHCGEPVEGPHAVCPKCYLMLR